MPEEDDVTASPSTGSSDTPSPAPAAVTSDGTPPVKDDRPVQNVVAEMNRKFQEQQQQISTLTQALTALVTQPSAPRGPLPSAQPREYTDAELRELARAGSPEATELLAERAAQRQNMAFQAEQQKLATVKGKLQAMYRNYPQLLDATHPLCQQAMANKQALLIQGHPNNYETDLEACVDAVLANPQSAATSAALEAARQSALSTHTTEPAPMRRPQPKPRQDKPLSPEVIKMARRMGHNDPQGAIKRFLKRVEDGDSVITPNVRAALGGEIE